MKIIVKCINDRCAGNGVGREIEAPELGKHVYDMSIEPHCKLCGQVMAFIGQDRRKKAGPWR